MTDQSGSGDRRGFTPVPQPAINPPRRIRRKVAGATPIVPALPEASPANPEPPSRQKSTTPRGDDQREPDGFPKERERKATKDENGKRQPTGDYPVGFARPPVATRFSGKPGPGRPKNSVSYDTVIKKLLGKKLKVRIDGRTLSVTQGEALLMRTVQDALGGKSRDARKHVLSDMARLMPSVSPEPGNSPQDYNEADKLTLEEFRRAIRAEVLAELSLDPAERADDAGDNS